MATTIGQTVRKPGTSTAMGTRNMWYMGIAALVAILVLTYFMTANRTATTDVVAPVDAVTPMESTTPSAAPSMGMDTSDTNMNGGMGSSDTDFNSNGSQSPTTTQSDTPVVAPTPPQGRSSSGQ